MRRLVGLAALLAVGGGGWAWYNSDRPMDESAAYSLACPALDAALKAGGAYRNTASKAFDQIEGSGKLNPELRGFVTAGHRVLNTSTPARLPKSVRVVVVSRCAAAGHPLANLSAK